MAIGQRPNYDDPGGGWGYDPTGGDPGGYIPPRGTGTGMPPRAQTNGNGTGAANGNGTGAANGGNNASTLDTPLVNQPGAQTQQLSPLVLIAILTGLYFLTR